MQAQVLSLVLEGVFRKFPGLKVVLMESGVSWLPACMWRANKTWKGVRVEVPWVDRPPADIIRHHFRLTIQPFDAPPDKHGVEQFVRADRFRPHAAVLVRLSALALRGHRRDAAAHPEVDRRPHAIGPTRWKRSQDCSKVSTRPPERGTPWPTCSSAIRPSPAPRANPTPRRRPRFRIVDCDIHPSPRSNEEVIAFPAQALAGALQVVRRPPAHPVPAEFALSALCSSHRSPRRLAAERWRSRLRPSTSCASSTSTSWTSSTACCRSSTCSSTRSRISSFGAGARPRHQRVAGRVRVEARAKAQGFARRPARTTPVAAVKEIEHSAATGPLCADQHGRREPANRWAGASTGRSSRQHRRLACRSALHTGGLWRSCADGEWLSVPITTRSNHSNAPLDGLAAGEPCHRRRAGALFRSSSFVFIEGGFGFIPGITWRMDTHFERFRSEVPHLKRRPSEYVREHFWFTDAAGR